jgi:hypothetical protein
LSTGINLDNLNIDQAIKLLETTGEDVLGKG